MTGKILVCLLVLGGIVVSVQTSAAVWHDSLLVNGKFDDDLFGWTGQNVSANNLGDQYALDGPFLTLGQFNTTQSVSQTIDITEGTGLTTLSFYYRLYTDDTANDFLSITVADSTTEELFIEELIPASRGDVALWTKHTLDSTKLDGKTVLVTLSVKNDSSKFTFVDLDTIRLNVDSYGELKGTVQAETGGPVRNAEITVHKPNNTKIWTGTSNKQGKFTVPELPGNTKKYRVILKKNDVSVTKQVSIDWAVQTKKTFTLNRL